MASITNWSEGAEIEGAGRAPTNVCSDVDAHGVGGRRAPATEMDDYIVCVRAPRRQRVVVKRRPGVGAVEQAPVAVQVKGGGRAAGDREAQVRSRRTAVTLRGADRATAAPPLPPLTVKVPGASVMSLPAAALVCPDVL